MKLNVYSIHDAAAGSFLRPMFMHADGQATRAFMDEVNKKDSLMYAHPDQFTLFRIGEFDDNSGAMTPCHPVSLGNGATYKEMEDNKIDVAVVLKALKELKAEVVYIKSSLVEE